MFDLSGYGPPAAEVLPTLRQHRLAIDGCQLVSASTIPDLDAPAAPT